MTRSVICPSLIGGCECDEGEGEKDDVVDDVDILRLVVLAGVFGDGGDGGVVHASGDVRVRPALRGSLGRQSGTIGFTTNV